MAWRMFITPGRACRNWGVRWPSLIRKTADFLVSRALLRFGRSYEQAVAAFQPYRKSATRTRKRAAPCGS